MRAARDERPRGTDLYVLAAMLTAAAAGRLLDALGLLPGVHEASAVRGAPDGWVTALLMAAAVAAAAARRWSRTSSLASTAAVVVPGQLLGFLAAEAAVRVAGGHGPLDPDGIVGAALQAALAVTLVLALGAVAVVALTLRPLLASAPVGAAGPRSSRGAGPSGHRLASLVDARGPPHGFAC